ncbi:MAG: hypothetical protein IKU03_09410 [Bacteroidales bacterium]|nr:hypothetical protein [Bacteroidales bacterium]
MKKRAYPFWILLTLLFAFTGCHRTDLTPAYIEIQYEDINNCFDVTNFNETHNLTYDSEQLGALLKHNFTHCNVYVNNKNLGCWQVPCRVPVLDINEGDSATVVILPAFRMTGMDNTVTGYPFINILRQKVMLQRGHTYHVSENPLSYIYSPAITIPFLETFSNTSPFSPTDTSISHTTFVPTVVEGRTAGEIVLNAGTNQSFDVTSSAFQVPVRNYYVFLEVTYKTEGNLEIGLKMSTAVRPNEVHQIGGIYPSDGEWKTIYFNLANTLYSNHYSGGDASNINLVLTGSGKANQETRYYIDDIKVIYIPRA